MRRGGIHEGAWREIRRLGVPFGGMTSEQYDAWGRKFLSEFKHPKFHVGVEGLIYQPMVELIRYLEANDFTVYIFTANEGAFLRLVAADLYGLPPSQVFGTSMRSEWVVENDKPLLVRTKASITSSSRNSRPGGMEYRGSESRLVEKGSFPGAASKC